MHNTLEKVFSRDTQAGTAIALVRLRVNADNTAGNYTNATYSGVQNAAALNAVNAATASGVFMAANPQDGNTAGIVGSAVLDLVGYANTTFHKQLMSHAAYECANAGIQMVTLILSARWKSTAAINQLTFLTDGTAFKDGSVFTLYGVQ